MATIMLPRNRKSHIVLGDVLQQVGLGDVIEDDLTQVRRQVDLHELRH